jgi:biopolymer transport protein ExbD
MRNAMLGKLYGKGRHRMQMAPMIDIVFQLLIFFLVASEVRPTEADLEANLPKVFRGPDNPDLTKFETVRIYLRNAPGDSGVLVSINNELLPGDAFRTVEARIRAAVGKLTSAHLVVLIDGEPSVRLQGVADALDSVLAGGATRIAFASPAP